jgi:hypothetical protein
VISRNLILAAAIALAGCGLDPQGGYRPMAQASGSQVSGSMSFDEANAQCWTLAYTLLGGNAMDSARSRTYDTCMHDRGWEDPRMRPQPRAVTVPGSR